jgi:hypothetical protein
MRALRLLFVALSVLFALSAQAHDFRDSRRLLLQIDPVHTLMVASVHVPKGARATMLRTLHDANHDGQLDPDEERGLAEALAPVALAGIEICKDGELLEALSLDWKVSAQSGLSSPIELFLLIELEGGEGVYELFDATAPHDHTHPHGGKLRHEGLWVEVELAQGLSFVSANHPVSDDFLGLPAAPVPPQHCLVFELQRDVWDEDDGKHK